MLYKKESHGGAKLQVKMLGWRHGVGTHWPCSKPYNAPTPHWVDLRIIVAPIHPVEIDHHPPFLAVKAAESRSKKVIIKTLVLCDDTRCQKSPTSQVRGNPLKPHFVHRDLTVC